MTALNIDQQAAALTRLRRRYDMLNALASDLLEATGYLNNPDYAETSVEQALRAAELVAKAAQLAEAEKFLRSRRTSL